MKLEIEEVSATKRKLQIEVPVETVAAEFDRAYRALSQKARIKGFRPGRIPRPVLERYFADDVRNDVATKLIQESVATAIREKEIPLVSRPEVELESKVEEKSPLRFSANLEIRPAGPSLDTTGLASRVLRHGLFGQA